MRPLLKVAAKGRPPLIAGRFSAWPWRWLSCVAPTQDPTSTFFRLTSPSSSRVPKQWRTKSARLQSGPGFLMHATIEILKLVSAMVAALCGLKSSRKKLIEYRAEKLRLQNKKNHRAIASVYPLLQEALHKFPAVDRVTLFRSHNGTGVPSIGQPCATSCLQEVHTDKTSPITRRWQSIPSDNLMVDCISEMMEHGSSSLCVEDGPEGILSDFAKGNNIKSVLAVPVSYMSAGFLFLNLCSASEDLSKVAGVLF